MLCGFDPHGTIRRIEVESASVILAGIVRQDRDSIGPVSYTHLVLHRERSGNPHILSGFHRLIFIDERRRHP